MLQEANSAHPREKGSMKAAVTRRPWPPDDAHLSHRAPGWGCWWHDGRRGGCSGAVPGVGTGAREAGGAVGQQLPRGFGCAPPSPGHVHRWLCPHGGPALPSGNVTPAVAWHWWLCYNDKLWFSYAANYPQLCLLICSSSPQRSFAKWLYFYFIFIDLLAMLRGEWTGI